MKKSIITSIIICFSLLSYNPIKNSVFAAQEKTNFIKNESFITKEQALKILSDHNNTVEYIYQGDESEFDFLSSKDLEGYVYLPFIETDIGYFIDKYTSSIYYFHPSGYLELAI